MPPKCSLMVFTDLDGTLIDHETYQWNPALPALQALRDLACPVILASSKTAAEMAPLRVAMGLQDWPAIVENGAGLLQPQGSTSSAQATYAALRDVLADIPSTLRALFRGFGDMDTATLSALTGLCPQAATQAQDRQFSEPGQWLGDATQRSAFVTHLQRYGITAQQGGRFLTLSFGRNKVDQMRALVTAYDPQYTVALGDAPNDVAMIEHATHGVIIANPHGSPLPRLAGEDTGQIFRTTATGPTGWNTAILSLIHRMQL